MTNSNARQVLRTDTVKNPLRVRLATPHDAEIVHTMVLEIADHEGSVSDVVADADTWRRMLTRPDVHVLLAVDEDAILGYASMTRRLNLWMGADLLALDDLYVRESARNRGVGRRLMVEVAQVAAPEGMTVVWGARLDNHDGHRFYERLGARLNRKVVAAWSPGNYAWAVAPEIHGATR